MTIAAGGQISPAPATADGATSNEATGKIVEFTAGASILLDTGTAEPVQYKIGKSITYVNGRGKVVNSGKMRKNRKVRVHLLKEGTDMVADKITIVKD